MLLKRGEKARWFSGERPWELRCVRVDPYLNRRGRRSWRLQWAKNATANFKTKIEDLSKFNVHVYDGGQQVLDGKLRAFLDDDGTELSLVITLNPRWDCEIKRVYVFRARDKSSFYRWCRAFGVVYTNTTKPQAFMGVNDSPTKHVTASSPTLLGATHNVRTAAARSAQRRHLEFQRQDIDESSKLGENAMPPSLLRETMFSSPDVARLDVRKAIRKIRAKRFERTRRDETMSSLSAGMDFLLESPVTDNVAEEIDDFQRLRKSVSSRHRRSNVSKRFAPTSHDRFASPLNDSMDDLEFVPVPRLGQKGSKVLDRSLPSYKSSQHQRYSIESHDLEKDVPTSSQDMMMEEKSLFHPGDRVEIQGLTHQTMYNGFQGKIFKYVPKDRLYVVELKSGEHLALCQENLVEATTKKHRIWKGPRYAAKPKRVRPTIDRGYGIKRKDSLEWLRALRLVGKTLDAGVYGDAHYVS